jgi:hypothetical protein
MKCTSKLILTVTISFISPYISYSQTTFQKAYRIIGHNVAKSVKQTIDGGYIIAGHMDDVGPNRTALMKLNSFGDTTWSKVYGTPIINGGTFFSVVQGSDSNYIACGERTDPISSSLLNVTKTDIYGNIIWIKNYNGNGLGSATGNVLLLENDGSIVVGAENGADNLALIKINPIGNVIWGKIYSDSGLSLSSHMSLCKTQDGGFLIVGASVYLGSPYGDIYVIKTDSLGNQIWAKIYGGTQHDVGVAVKQVENGNFTIVGTTSSFGAGNNDIYLLKIDNAGNVIWSKTYGTPENQFGTSLTNTSDGGYLIRGTTHNLLSTFPDITCFIKTDLNGDTLWTKAYETYSFGQQISSIELTTDYGFITAGYTQQFTNWYSMLVIKTDSIGHLLPCLNKPVNIIVGNPPTVIDSAGSSLTTIVSSHILNTSANSVSPLIYDICNQTGIQSEMTLENAFQIFPNPTYGVINLHCPDILEDVDISIFNSLGGKIYHKFFTELIDHSIDLITHAKGLYVITIIHGKNKIIRKVILQ